MSLLQLLTAALKATAAFYVLIFMLESLGLLSIPDRAYTPFGILTASIFFYLMILQLPNKNNANNKSAGKSTAKAVG